MTPQIKKLTTSEVVEDKTERISSGEFSRDSSKESCSFFVCFVFRMRMRMLFSHKQ